MKGRYIMAEEYRVFLSLPFRGKTDEEIFKHICMMKARFLAKHPEYPKVTFIDNFIKDLDDVDKKYKHKHIAFLSKAIEKLATCDAIYIGTGADTANGCIVEDYIAVHYGMQRFFEEEDID